MRSECLESENIYATRTRSVITRQLRFLNKQKIDFGQSALWILPLSNQHHLQRSRRYLHAIAVCFSPYQLDVATFRNWALNKISGLIRVPPPICPFVESICTRFAETYVFLREVLHPPRPLQHSTVDIIVDME